MFRSRLYDAFSLLLKNEVSSISNVKVLNKTKAAMGSLGSVRYSNSRHDRVWTYKTLPKKDEGTSGETSVDLDLGIASLQGEVSLFPDENSPSRIFDGTLYERLPVVDIKVTKNNTIMTVSDYKGVPQAIRSCGIEGFKNTRKGTNIAAQATAISFSTIIQDKGFKTVRVRIQGLGPGRTSSIKGLQMGGLNIVSITDTTRVSDCPPRPRKARRL